MSADRRDTVIAVGWATVELDRAAEAFAPLLAPGSVFAPAADCLALGARCRIAHSAVELPMPGVRDPLGGSSRTVVLLEPSTEGRLAAYLARHDEGWCATWIADDTADATDRTHAAGWPSVSIGPLGPERLAPGSPPGGPYRFLVRPATIRS